MLTVYGKWLGEAGETQAPPSVFTPPAAAELRRTTEPLLFKPIVGTSDEVAEGLEEFLGTARTTREEAVEVGKLLKPRGIQRILLVTDGDHMARALPLFERAGFEVLPAPVFDTVYDAAGPEDRLSTSRSMLMELGARLYYRAAGYL